MMAASASAMTMVAALLLGGMAPRDHPSAMPWRKIRLTDFGPAEIALWRRARPTADPGRVVVQLSCLGGRTTFIAAIQRTGAKLSEQVSYRDARGRQHIVFADSDLTRPFVIWRSTDRDGRHEVLVVENIESWSDSFRCHRGKLVRRTETQ